MEEEEGGKKVLTPLKYQASIGASRMGEHLSLLQVPALLHASQGPDIACQFSFSFFKHFII
jgi:hypothetical protein